MRKPTHASTRPREHACAGLAQFKSRTNREWTLMNANQKETTEDTDYTETRGNEETANER